MPEITIYTNDGDCANGVAELNPFTVGDTTNDWTLKFVNEDGDFYAPSNVTMRVGHTNGLPDGTYNNAFKWVDRADNQSTGSISVASGVPTLSFNTNPLGGVVGTNGVYILRGPELDGSISSASIEYPGRYLQYYTNQPYLFRIPNPDGGSPGLIQLGVSGGYQVQTYTQGSTTAYNTWVQGFYTSVSVIEAGSGFGSDQYITPAVNLSQKFIQVIAVATGSSTSYVTINEPGELAAISIKVNAPKYEFPFMRDESGNDIIAATTLSPYSDGKIDATTQYDHSTLVIRPETVATASLTQSGTDWVGTMDPVNAYVTERLALRNSTQLDLQIRGDGRTLFQGQLTVLNKIA
jgi:hypothetical protein